MRQPAEFVVNQRYQKIDGIFVTLAGAFEEERNLVGIHRTIMLPDGDAWR